MIWFDCYGLCCSKLWGCLNFLGLAFSDGVCFAVLFVGWMLTLGFICRF